MQLMKDFHGMKGNQDIKEFKNICLIL